MVMEADDLDNLIADQIGGVTSVLESERKAAAPTAGAAAAAGAGASGDWAKEAVKDLQSGPSRSDGGAGGDEAFFANLVKTFQDENFQKAMADAMKASDGSPTAGKAAGGESAAKSLGPAAPAATAGGATSSSGAKASGSADAGSEEFLQNFLQSFDKAVGSDANFEKSLTSLMTSMLSNDLICEPLKDIADKLEPWLKSQKGLPPAERKRYEDQLRLYRHILGIYRTRPDPLPEDAREEVQRYLAELQMLGQPPEEVMKQIQPKEAEEGGESFDDFMKQMGLNDSLGSAEQDLLKKLSEDPEELTKVMRDMAEGLPEEACKQQ